jgi:hypothetical protein
MPASLQKCSDNRKINPNSERVIQCSYCPQKYSLFGMTGPDRFAFCATVLRVFSSSDNTIIVSSTRVFSIERQGVCL